MKPGEGRRVGTHRTLEAAVAQRKRLRKNRPNLRHSIKEAAGGWVVTEYRPSIEERLVAMETRRTAPFGPSFDA